VRVHTSKRKTRQACRKACRKSFLKWASYAVYIILYYYIQCLAYTLRPKIARALRIDQYRIQETVSPLKFERFAPAFITLLNDSNPKHQ